jgi:primosomal protein N' (replication factor Y)
MPDVAQGGEVEEHGQQLELLRAATRGKKPRPPAATSVEQPIARVIVDLPLPHLDRLFDYTVPEPMSADARPGVRVRVRFAGQDVEAYVVERADRTDHGGRLSPLRRVVSPEPVLTPQVLALARAVAAAYAGNVTDVLRLAVPARHARTEKEDPRAPDWPGEPPTAGDVGASWRDYPAGPAFLARVASGQAPQAVWTALPGPGRWARELAAAAAAALTAGRGALLVVPDRRDVDVLDAALTEALGPDRHVRLEADLGPTARYRNFLALLRGRVQVVVGTRAAAFAPVRDLGLVAIWDDGDDGYAEPRAPYPHTREVLTTRAGLEDAALLVGSWSRSLEAQAWVRTGRAHPVVADTAARRAAWAPATVAATVLGAEEDPSAAGRLPAPAWRAVRDGLRSGPVLVQVPRAGYLPGLSCQACRKPARCTACHGPLALAGHGPDEVAACRWCGRPAADWACPHCSGRRLRASAVGVGRTAEELGRAFAGATLVVPRPDAPTPAVPPGALVVATPGLEPPVAEGYAAAVLLDGWRLLERPHLGATQEALRRWLAASAMVRPGPAGGRVVICADPQAPAVQALVRHDPAWQADRELDERVALGFPPAVVMAALTGRPDAVRSLVDLVEQPPGTEVLGPIPLPDDRDGRVQTLLRAPRERAGALAHAVHTAAAVRSARREPDPVRIRIDPDDLA